MAGDLDVGDSDDLLDFNQLSECLITSAAAANGDRDVGDDIEDDTMPSTTASPVIDLTNEDSSSDDEEL